MNRAIRTALVMLLSCGGQTAVDIPPSLSDFPPPQPNAVPYDARLGTLAVVPGGRARIGGWWINTGNLYEWSEHDGGVPTSLDVTPMSCAQTDAETYGGWTFGTEVIVAPFRLMTMEVTNRAYSICVDSGPCAPPDIATSVDWHSPAVANQPVVLTWVLARDFCRHYGGDLPTAGEYARAAVGDAETYAQSNILSQVLQCSLAANGPNLVGARCQSLSGALGPLADVGSDPDDLGPFGHFDLYGNAWEWARGYFEYAPAFCTSPLYEHDIPLSFPSADAGDGTLAPNTIAYAPERALGIPLPIEPLKYETSPDIPVHDPPRATDIPVYGFRCAFPTP